jgi:hypothetical protein
MHPLECTRRFPVVNSNHITLLEVKGVLPAIATTRQKITSIHLLYHRLAHVFYNDPIFHTSTALRKPTDHASAPHSTQANHIQEIDFNR